MSHKSKSSLVKQVSDALKALLKIGESRHTAKKTGEDARFIYSWETYHTYMKHCIAFVEYCKTMFHSRTLEECKSHADDWLASRAGLSPSTLKLEVSALRKLYGGDVEISVKIPERRRSDIKRSRGKAARDIHFSEDKNAAMVAFCRSTGLRASELRDLFGSDLLERDGEYFVHVRNGKGGKERDARVIGDVQNVIDLMNLAGDGKVFKKVKRAADIHSYRRDYTRAYYNAIARPTKDLPRSLVYICRRDKKNVRYDKSAMLTVSRSLGHNRIDVIARNYLD